MKAEKTHPCPVCEKLFATPEAAEQHRGDRHDKPHPYACPQCQRQCKSALNLERHIAEHHALSVNRRPSLSEIEATCIECGEKGELVTGERIYPHRPDLYAKRFYLCQCGAYCGCHPGTVVPLGNPCGPETRRARSAAHEAFDPLWRSKAMSRQSAYAWLAEATGIRPEVCHIGMMNAEQARSVVRAVLARRARAA